MNYIKIMKYLAIARARISPYIDNWKFEISMPIVGLVGIGISVGGTMADSLAVAMFGLYILIGVALVFYALGHSNP